MFWDPTGDRQCEYWQWESHWGKTNHSGRGGISLGKDPGVCVYVLDVVINL